MQVTRRREDGIVYFDFRNETGNTNPVTLWRCKGVVSIFVEDDMQFDLSDAQFVNVLECDTAEQIIAMLSGMCGVAPQVIAEKEDFYR